MSVFREQGFSRNKKKFPWLGFLLIALVVSGGLGFLIYQGISVYFFNPLEIGPSEVDVSELWQQGNYQEIIEYTESELQVDPLNQTALTIGGFAYFHQGYAQINLEEKLDFINQGIVYLRKTFLQNDPFLRPEVYYILGKSYYHKGKYYSDLAIRYLELAYENGIDVLDLFEYLGLAYSSLGLFEDSEKYFLLAAEKNPTDSIYWTLGHTNYQMDQLSRSQEFLERAISMTEEWELEQKCRFLLGEIHTRNGEYPLAESQYNAILEKNPASADAHFFLGELYFEQNLQEKARAEWRRAFNIDQLHFGANQRLFGN